MNVASLELCKELCELSKWGVEQTAFHWYRDSSGKDFNVLPVYECAFYESDEYFPAYDLSLLLRKLPNGSIVKTPNNYCTRYQASYRYNQHDGESLRADTPEDAACKLAIELFKQGILK